MVCRFGINSMKLEHPKKINPPQLRFLCQVEMGIFNLANVYSAENL
jgi:hypothetical protein